MGGSVTLVLKPFGVYWGRQACEEIEAQRAWQTLSVIQLRREAHSAHDQLVH